MVRENGLQGFVDKGRLSTTADTCYNDEFTEWKGYVDMLEIVA